MVDRVLGHGARRGTASEPAVAARLAERKVFVVDVADLADRRVAVRGNEPHLARGEFHVGVNAFLGHEDRVTARRTADLAAAAPLELDVVGLRPQRNVLERQRVARQDLRRRTVRYRPADGYADRCQDVPPLLVLELDQRNARGPVGVVLDRQHPRRHPQLVTLEIDDAVPAPVPAAPAARGHAPGRIAAAARAEFLGQFLFRPLVLGRKLRKIGYRRPAQRRREWPECLESHIFPLSQVDRVALLQGHDRLLPFGRPAKLLAHALQLSRHHLRVDARDLYLINGLDGLFDLDLVGPGIDREQVLVLDRLTGPFFGAEQRLQNLIRSHAHDFSLFRSPVYAHLVITHSRCDATSSALTSSAVFTDTPWMLREAIVRLLSRFSTRNSGLSSFKFLSTAATCLVFGAASSSLFSMKSFPFMTLSFTPSTTARRRISAGTE